MSKKRDGDYQVNITWCWEDVKEIRPGWSKDKCLEQLHTIGRHLQDQSIENGWEILECLLPSEVDEYIDGKLTQEGRQ